MSAIWKPIPGFVGHYEVSDGGQVRSVKRNSVRVLRQNGSGRGYPAVALCIDGVPRTKYVHHLVAESFIGPRPDGLDICHNNGDFTDNRVENLRYDTHHANMRDAVSQGRHPESQRTHCLHGHELTPDNVRTYVRASADGNGVKTRRRCVECQRAKWTRWNRKAAERKRSLLAS